MGEFQLDDRDRQLVSEYMARYEVRRPSPRVGDFIDFSDGQSRRITHVWPDHVQTTDGRYGQSFHLGDGYVSYSGALDPGVPTHSLTQTDLTRPGSVWIFHHGISGAGRGVYDTPDFRVYTCPLPSEYAKSGTHTQ